MLTAMGDVMRHCYAKGWITTRDGNVSLCKKGGKYLYITPSGLRKTIVHPEQIVKLEIVADPETLERRPRVLEQQRPSGELWMHWNIQCHTPRTRAVVHIHPTHVVAAIYRGFDLQKICADFPEISRYTKVGPSVPPLPALSREFADATADALGVHRDGSLDYDIVGQANHGVCSVGPDPWSAYEHIERLDHICEIVLKSGVSPGVGMFDAVLR
ncbi:MAG: class II aldolase/adducin family protein [Nitrospirota bacterium]|nr:class II aldolase/adducin family protein [Nitrospirota bacterium]MDE3223862.1 class II aldolase/adducin family protein [Nitrospirota bacterium]MDE3241596.1 class II aldolase/adducin family protein [Nitrospirota bacterium]